MTDDTCTFTYISAKDFTLITATGIEYSWLNLKLEFNRRGEGLAGARYYKRISTQGPELFAVKNDQTVWYHDENEWYIYRTAKDIKYDKIRSSCLNPNPPASSNNEDDDDDDETDFGQQEEN